MVYIERLLSCKAHRADILVKTTRIETLEPRSGGIIMSPLRGLSCNYYHKNTAEATDNQMFRLFQNRDYLDD